MMLKGLVLALLATGQAVAQIDLSNRWTPDPAWSPMTQDQAESWLYGQVVRYTDGASQFFEEPAQPNAPAYTEYADGFPSSGEYTLIDGEYCSVWPPSALWECYDLEIHETGKRIRFISEEGILYEARPWGS